MGGSKLEQLGAWGSWTLRKTLRLTAALAATLALIGAPLPAEEQPDFGDLSVSDGPSAPAEDSGRIVTRSDGRYYRYDGRELFADIAQKAYGDSSLWYLIYRQNRARLQPGSDTGREGGAVLLRLPDPPEKRVTTENGQRQVQVIPGDTFMTLAKRIYGSPRYWTALWLANRDRLPDPDDPYKLFATGTSEPKVFVLPSGEEAAGMVSTAGEDFGATGAGPRAPASSPDLGDGPLSTGPSAPSFSSRGKSYETASPQPSKGAASDQSASVTGAFRKTTNPIASLDVSDASQIGLDEAKTILEGTGMLRSGEPLSAGLKRLHKGYTYRSGGGVLDSAARVQLFREYKLLRAALDRWAAYPDIGAKSTPRLVDQWIKRAASKMTALPEGQRYPLIHSLLMQESSVRQWRNFRPIVGQAGDTGFGQFLPSTAKQFGINPYDPEQNILGVALFLNSLIKNKRGNVREALASYNGGGRPPASSYRYADQILQRAR